MKFIATKGAPDIPIEIINAQELGSLVIFCGAGVSIASGLPTFSELVEKVYEKLGEQLNDLEEKSYKSGFYDRTLGILESRIIGPNSVTNPVRKAIIELLSIDVAANVNNHRTILELSKTKNQNYRLVTTNVDHGFLLADRNLKYDAAPKLPVPKPYKWDTVVYLHGIIQTNDPNGKQLVFTSGDFGTAYLTERWASKFVTELFRHFTVLFVGYSVDDPVIRYMTDAIASEKLWGYKSVNQPYVLAHTPPSKIRLNETIWRSRGIEPILYSYSHSNLYSSLEEWKNFVRDGLNAKERVVRKEAKNTPVFPYDQDPGINRLIDVLSENPIPITADISGYPAKVFRDINNPPAPIEWLRVFEEEKLLSIPSLKKEISPISENPIGANIIRPNKISWHLWGWLLHHLENNKLIFWVIEKGCHLHPQLKNLVLNHISRVDISEPYRTFWRIITSNFVLTEEMDIYSHGFDILKRLSKNVNNLTLSEISNLFEPYFKISKSTFMYDLYDDEILDLKNPYSIDIVIGLNDWLFEELRKTLLFPDELGGLLLPATNALMKSLDFWSYAGQASNTFDRSHWDMVSISPHPQNSYHSNWIILVEICRELWLSVWTSRKEEALSIFYLWQSIKYPVFRRLSLYIYSITTIGDMTEITDYLIDDEGWWLWSTTMKREVFRLLDKISPNIDKINKIKLINQILVGPPRDMFLRDIEESEWQKLYDHQIWLILSKLNSFGMKLPKKATDILDTLSNKYPVWKLQPEERDEFSTWTESSFGTVSDIKQHDLFAMDNNNIIEILAKEDIRWGEGLGEVFRLGCKENIDKVLSIAHLLVQEKNWDINAWYSILLGLNESGENTWNNVSSLLIQADQKLFHDVPWAIARWVKTNAKSIPINSIEEDSFWQLYKLMIDNCTNNKELESSNPVNYAINHPIGIITESLFDRFGMRKFESGYGISDNGLIDSLNYIVLSKNKEAVAGLIILASRLHYLHSIDPLWTEKELIPLFNWENHELASALWQGYLWNPRISADLAISLKDNIVETIIHIDALGESSSNLIRLFAVICLQFPDLYKAREKYNSLVEAGVKNLAFIADLFWDTVKEDIKSADDYWRNRIYPFMKSAWPKSAEFVSDKISYYFSLMLSELDDAFVEALDYLEPQIKPFANITLIIMKLCDGDLPEKHPESVFKLISLIFTTNYEWPSDSFRELLDRLTSSDPSIKEEFSYRIIDEYLTNKNR